MEDRSGDLDVRCRIDQRANEIEKQIQRRPRDREKEMPYRAERSSYWNRIGAVEWKLDPRQQRENSGGGGQAEAGHGQRFVFYLGAF